MSNFTFRTPRKNNATTDIVAQLEEALTSGYYKVGDRLPCERDLQKLFQVGRGAIREALRMLRQKGWTETRKGATGGTFVIQATPVLLGENMLFLLQQSSISYSHLIEFRQCIDKAIARLMLMRCTPEQAEELRQKSREICQLASQDPPDVDTIIARDAELNILCAKISGNPLLLWIMETIQNCLGTQDNVLYQHKSYTHAVGKNCIDYIEAILNHDIEKIDYLLGHHYALLQHCLSENNHATEVDNQKT